MQLIQVAYSAPLVLLVPIAVLTVFRLFSTDQSRFEESQGWGIRVGSLWSSILIPLTLGLPQPLRYSPVLLQKLIYKSVRLGVYVEPRLLRVDAVAVPWGIAGSFAVIVVVWPFIIPWAYLLGLS